MACQRMRQIRFGNLLRWNEYVQLWVKEWGEGGGRLKEKGEDKERGGEGGGGAEKGRIRREGGNQFSEYKNNPLLILLHMYMSLVTLTNTSSQGFQILEIIIHRERQVHKQVEINREIICRFHTNGKFHWSSCSTCVLHCHKKCIA